MHTFYSMRDDTELSTGINNSDSGPLGIVHQFIHEQSDYTIVTERFPDYKGSVGKYIKVPNREPVTVWMERELGMARLDKKAFRDWLIHNRYPQATIIKTLHNKYGMREARGYIRPNEGDVDTTRIRVFELGIEEP